MCLKSNYRTFIINKPWRQTSSSASTHTLLLSMMVMLQMRVICASNSSFLSKNESSPSKAENVLMKVCVCRGVRELYLAHSCRPWKQECTHRFRWHILHCWSRWDRYTGLPPPHTPPPSIQYDTHTHLSRNRHYHYTALGKNLKYTNKIINNQINQISVTLCNCKTVILCENKALFTLRTIIIRQL